MVNIKNQVCQSVNPATEEVLGAFEQSRPEEVEEGLNQASRAFRQWRGRSFSERADLFKKAAAYLRRNKGKLAGLITSEMGKPITQAEAEVEKCALNCEYYAEHAEKFLTPEQRQVDDRESYVQFTPLGTVLAIMPWNFPLWQVIRFAAPALMAGNTAILKHASNVPQCALAIQEIFTQSGFPRGVFQSLLISSSAAGALIEDSRIAAVTLTGSDRAGREVGSRAGESIKKSVLELGGSDPFIVLEDADLEAAAKTGVRARFQNAGQSCIAAKRFIITAEVFEDFQERFVEEVRNLKVGDPTDASTFIGPLARADLRDSLQEQVGRSKGQGARIIIGGEKRPGRGFFFEPTVLTDVSPDNVAAVEEIFGPVAAMIRAGDAAEAIRLANDSPYGLGSNLWTADLERARKLAGQIEAGQVFINGMTASDPRLPFGGVKNSGYGRELSEYGIREFVNIQTVVVAK